MCHGGAMTPITPVNSLLLSTQCDAGGTLDKAIISHHTHQTAKPVIFGYTKQKCLPLKAHTLATQLPFHCKASLSVINCIYKIPFKITKQCQYFLKHFLPFSKVINLSMVTLQAIYLPAVAIDKAIFSAQQVWRQIFFLTLQPLLVGIHKCLSEVYQLTDITLPSVWCLVFFFSPWEISDKEEVQIVGGSY